MKLIFSGKRQILFLNIIYTIALLLVVTPLLLVARYNYPTADDWSFGRAGYQVLQNGGGIIDLLKASLNTVIQNYHAWEGRFAATLFATFQPGIFGEKYYSISTWIMVGGIFFGEWLMCKAVLGKLISQGNNATICVGILFPVLVLQFLYVPYPVESLYWYVGSVNYTFVYGLSLTLITCFIGVAGKKESNFKFYFKYLWAMVLAVLVGGNNFATALSTVLAILLLLVFLSYRNKRMDIYLLRIALVLIGSFMCSVFAPANFVRLDANFNGETRNALWAVGMSLVRSATNIYSWTNLKVFLMLLLILPFLWKAVGETDYEFRWPGIITLITFGIYASQCTPTMYVDGTTGGRRMADILYYSYYIWLVGNLGYWIGWLRKKKKVELRFSIPPLLYCGGVGILLLFLLLSGDKREMSSYEAYRILRQGWGEQYAAEWEERLRILKDDSIKQVEFSPISVPVDLIMYTDFEEESGNYWVNTAAAKYYGKDYIHLISKEGAK